MSSIYSLPFHPWIGQLICRKYTFIYRHHLCLYKYIKCKNLSRIHFEFKRKSLEVAIIISKNV